jgi:hypothetical protein
MRPCRPSMAQQVPSDDRLGARVCTRHRKSEFAAMGDEWIVYAMQRSHLLLPINTSDSGLDQRNAPVRSSFLYSMPPIPVKASVRSGSRGSANEIGMALKLVTKF